MNTSHSKGFAGQPFFHAMKEPCSFRRRLWSILIPFILYSTQICCAVGASSAKDSSMPSTTTTLDQKNNEEQVVAVQLFLVRHGETEGNKLSLTLGQSDSPLTTLGRRQAQALGETAWIKDSSPFWRIYSSDLSRAEKTTRLILEGVRGAAVLDQEKRRDLNNGENDNGNQIMPRLIRLDARLRELSKGVKQGLPKSLSYKEAYEWHVRETPNEEIPLLETDDDGWSRMRAFVNEVICDAVVDAKEMRGQKDEQECNNMNQPPSSRHTVTTTETTTTTTTHINKKADHPPAYKVLIISHSALLRIFLRRLLGDERLKSHPNARFDADGHFYLPNTSLTILEIRARVASSRSQRNDDEDDGKDSLPTIRVDPVEESAENVDIVQLTWAGHLVRMSEPEVQFANGE